ncbi:TMEM198/TM7SF3 family protein, partial [Candidatus Dojkabacteria bacterium]
LYVTELLVGIVQINLRIILSIIFGIILSLLAKTIFEFGIFLFGGAVGILILISLYMLNSQMIANTNGIDQNSLLWIILCFILGGIASVLLKKYVLILLTSLGGSTLIVLSIFLYTTKISDFSDKSFQEILTEQKVTLPYLILLLAMFVFSTFFQLGGLGLLLNIKNLFKNRSDAQTSKSKKLQFEQEQKQSKELTNDNPFSNLDSYGDHNNIYSRETLHAKDNVHEFSENIKVDFVVDINQKEMERKDRQRSNS